MPTSSLAFVPRTGTGDYPLSLTSPSYPTLAPLYLYAPPPRSFLFGFGGSTHVHYFGVWRRGRGEAGLLNRSCSCWETRCAFRRLSMWGPSRAAFPMGVSFVVWEARLPGCQGAIPGSSRGRSFHVR
eukprot:scaffold82207_cov31-Tisochrysis_lutea.AAC.4